MVAIRFTGNYEDLSTDRGYQFKFFCEKCNNGYMSSFKTSTMGVLGSAARVAEEPNRRGSAPYCFMYCCSEGAVETSTEEARNSRTRRRLRRTRSESVFIFIPGSTFREQAGTSTREPSSSTTQTRQTFTGVRFSR